MNSEGCRLTTKSGSQRRDPFTDLPMPGISTRRSSAAPTTNSQGASCCQALIGTWNATYAAITPTPTKSAWRTRKYQARYPVCAEASAVAIEDEYTITSPIASSRIAAHASEAS